MFDFWEYNFWEYIIGAIAIGLIVLICWAGYKEQQAWDAFKTVHHCTLTGRTAPGTATGITSNGNAAVVTTAPKATYLCDDGVSYTRDEY
jgi:hypothetical protein